MIDPFAFGRPRDDRGPLLAAAAAAVALHVLAIFIPLPATPAPETPAPMVPIGPVVTRIAPALPELPERPPEVLPASRPLPVPFEIPEAPEFDVDEPEIPIESTLEAVDGMPGWAPGEIDPPAQVGVVDESTAGLVPPVLIDKPAPEFPRQATWRRLPGVVILHAVIDREGNVTDIELIEVTEPDLGYSASAIEAVSRWKYRPGELRGRPVAVQLTVRVEFSVN